MTSTSDIYGLKIIALRQIETLSHSNGLHREKSCLFKSTSRLQKIFLNEGNRLYCEGRDHIDVVDRGGDETRATENPPISPIVINFHRRYEILFANHFDISEIGTAKNQSHIINTKG